MHTVIYDEEALQNLEKLEKKIRKRIFEKINSTKENPFHYFEGERITRTFFVFITQDPRRSLFVSAGSCCVSK
jgi:hypothetical protein